MSDRIHRAVLAALLAGALTGCDFLNITDVDNPRTTIDDLAKAARPTAALLSGVRAEFAQALGAVVTVTENVSDNYSIQGTGLDAGLDEPTAIHPLFNHINATGATGIYFNVQELRALADYVLTDIAPGDTSATAAQVAELHSYRGMALLLLSENFVAAPVENDGAPVDGDSLAALAIADFQQARTADPGGAFDLPAQAALARAHRAAGNAAQAEAFAQAVLTADPAFLHTQGYDETSIVNTPFIFLVLRATLQEMQPNPRLDFLDPKYTTETAEVPVSKAEEMHLILAEVELSRGNFLAGLGHVADAVTLAQTRPTLGFSDVDLRKNGDLTIRPRHDTMEVRADATSPYRLGLVLNRPGLVQTPRASNSSLDADSVRTLLVTDTLSVYHAFFLARQEILFLEGRRMGDLGIRLPMMQREIDTNPSIGEGDPGTQVLVPGYIPGLDSLDRFTPRSPYNGGQPPLNPNDVTADTDQITILFDMNKRLAQNKVSPFGLP
ncbi:MAG: hypothetical protein ACREMJ_06430 [Gemmatimonadales bacterium]